MTWSCGAPSGKHRTRVTHLKLDHMLYQGFRRSHKASDRQSAANPGCPCVMMTVCKSHQERNGNEKARESMLG